MSRGILPHLKTEPSEKEFDSYRIAIRLLELHPHITRPESGSGWSCLNGKPLRRYRPLCGRQVERPSPFAPRGTYHHRTDSAYILFLGSLDAT